MHVSRMAGLRMEVSGLKSLLPPEMLCGTGLAVLWFALGLVWRLEVGLELWVSLVCESLAWTGVRYGFCEGVGAGD